MTIGYYKQIILNYLKINKLSVTFLIVSFK